MDENLVVDAGGDRQVKRGFSVYLNVGVHKAYRRKPGPVGLGGSRSGLRSKPGVRVWLVRAGALFTRRGYNCGCGGFGYLSYPNAMICRIGLWGPVQTFGAVVVKVKRIVMIKLAVTDEQAAALKQTLLTCNRAADFVSDVAQNSSDRRAFTLHHSVYTQVKLLGLSAQPAVRVIKKVADAYTTRAANLKAGNYGRRGTKRYAGVADSAVRFRSLAAQPFDDRCLSWQLDSSTVSIWTVSGRMKGVPFVCAPWQRKLLADRKGESDLVFRDVAGHTPSCATSSSTRRKWREYRWR
ncbi:hypothetical protein [Rhodococcus sp. OK302]|uniref:hypothetical protein n=1 Tax=Rhodococcus sp. OK302 TaxID=1882769 RepID=UPI00269AD2E7